MPTPRSLEPVDLSRRIDDLSNAEFKKLEEGHRELVLQNVCRTCALEMLRQDIFEMFRMSEPPRWEDMRSALEEWQLCATASLVQSRAAEQEGDLIKCDLCHKTDGRPAWIPAPKIFRLPNFGL
jgi:hypothetical protein